MGDGHFESASPLEGEVVEAETPREGTLAWLELQEHVDIAGLGEIPACHRLDLSSMTLYLGLDDGYCRVQHADGRRCRAPRTQRYGLCMPHAGGGARDHAAMSRLAHAQKARLRVARTQLGIGAQRTSDPRQIARIEAQARANDIAAALLAPLDDGDLSAMAQQTSALRILDAVSPQQTVTVTVDVPQDEAGVQGMTWAEMQALAAQLLGDTTETQQLEPA